MFKKKNKIGNAMARKLIVQAAPKSYISEQYRSIRTNIKFSMPDQDLKTLLVTSSGPSEGKSTTSANIAGVFSQEGKRVLLIDADMRKPTAHYTFKLRNSHGLSNLLTKQCEIHEAIQQTNVEGLWVLPSGVIPPNPAELLASNQMEFVLEQLKQDFDLIILDAPPILSVTDAQIISHKSDATILVVNSGATGKEEVAKAKDILDKSKANVIGVVMNNFALQKDHYYYQYYGNEG
ncbi:CpsD/CapB family tyrosine-protein kinase [Ureibacillus manganicus]|uniref:non-specific protein-tyrosine kinase n=1 Tax=Ureibacillus manganicus DSM 26584 TaxID=1384049 RepID=A0A0A3I189_9BACL|nr:CpsD/CapB family tyrosine-protein kinase [Ureibacillus manganicus]KGR76403.1 capsular biosynthesis protein [Ureibacillus manganicus DSM 26584]